MSFADLEDRSSGAFTIATVVAALITVPLSTLLAMEGLMVFGVWNGWARVVRTLLIVSPIYAMACLGLARGADRRGERVRRSLFLSMLLVPAGLFVGFVLIVAIRA